jgi:hypothetical protein
MGLVLLSRSRLRRSGWPRYIVSSARLALYKSLPGAAAFYMARKALAVSTDGRNRKNGSEGCGGEKSVLE